MVGAASFYSKLDELQSHFKTHCKIREYPAHSSKVHSVGWSSDGRRLASGSFDKSVSVFTLKDDRLVSRLKHNLSCIICHTITLLWFILPLC